MGDLKVVVYLATTGQQLCSLSLQQHDTVECLRRAVADKERGCAFDLVFAGQILRNHLTLAVAGLHDHAAVQLVRRQLAAADLTITKYSERSLGCLRFGYPFSSSRTAELQLVGVRCGYGDIMSFEWYSDPASLEDAEGSVFARYRKIVRDLGEDVRTRHVLVRRPLRLRSDLAVARQADGGAWIPFFRCDPAGPQGDPQSVEFLPSGRRLEVLDAMVEGDWLNVRCPSLGEGWVRRRDAEQLGEVALDWAGPEEVLSETVLE